MKSEKARYKIDIEFLTNPETGKNYPLKSIHLKTKPLTKEELRKVVDRETDKTKWKYYNCTWREI